jgi:anti-sigma factor RsiW
MCSQFEQAIPLYVQSKLSLSETRRVETHMSMCPQCRKEADRLAGKQRAKQELATDLDDGQFAQLRARMAKELAAQTSSPGPAWLTWLRS